MASKPVPIKFIAFIVFFSVCLQPSSSQPRANNVNPLREMIRSRRQVCVDGSYEHEGKTCCKCAAGQYLMKHCSSQEDRICGYCENGVTYNSHPNSFESCQLCRSCSQPNANLEVAEPCTIARDTKCRCKEGHYCSSNTGSCEICHPCTVCSTSVMGPCTATNDTVCSEPGGNRTGAVVGSVCAVSVVILASVIAVFFWWKRKASRKSQTPDIGQRTDDKKKPLTAVTDVDIERFLPEIAEVLGWKSMKHFAMQVGISDTTIEACQLDHQGDSQEQTLQLLRKSVEKEGKHFQQKMFQFLEKSGKRNTSEKIHDILRGNSPAVEVIELEPLRSDE